MGISVGRGKRGSMVEQRGKQSHSFQEHQHFSANSVEILNHLPLPSLPPYIPSSSFPYALPLVMVVGYISHQGADSCLSWVVVGSFPKVLIGHPLQGMGKPPNCMVLCCKSSTSVHLHVCRMSPELAWAHRSVLQAWVFPFLHLCQVGGLCLVPHNDPQEHPALFTGDCLFKDAREWTSDFLTFTACALWLTWVTC